MIGIAQADRETKSPLTCSICRRSGGEALGWMLDSFAQKRYSVLIDWPKYDVLPHFGGRVRCDIGWSLDAQWNRKLVDFDLWFVWAGRGAVQLVDRELPLRPGTCLWMRHDRFYLATQNPNDRLGVTFVHFDLIRDGEIDRSTERLPAEAITVADVHATDAILRRVAELLPNGRQAGPSGSADEGHRRRTAASLLRGVLMDYDARARQSEEDSPSATDRHHRDVVLSIAARIDDEPDRVPSIDELAREAGYSRDHFTRVFKDVLGQSPRDYVIASRVNRAAQLLTESSLPISQVAYASGYDDVYYFSRQFRQKTGHTPSAYRRGV